MKSALAEIVDCWMDLGKLDRRRAPDAAALESAFGMGHAATRPGACPRALRAWERRHGYRLPAGLRSWLMLSDGLYLGSPLVHPISAIGPMIPFAPVPGMIVQPESWFEVGNPNLQTICVDLAYRLPGGGHPMFTSGDAATNSPPRIVAPSFEEWFLELLRQGGREYWFDPGFVDLGDPWSSHRKHVSGPPLRERLKPFVGPVARLFQEGANELEIAVALGLSRPDVEAICRHVQHKHPFPAAS
jgi:hypothetical protein